VHAAGISNLLTFQLCWIKTIIETFDIQMTVHRDIFL